MPAISSNPPNSFSKAPRPEGEKKFLYYFHLRAKRIYELCGSPAYPTLGAPETAVLLAFDMFGELDGTFKYPTIETLVRMTGLTRTKVDRAIRRLKDAALLIPTGVLKTGVRCYDFGPALLVTDSDGLSWPERLGPKLRHSDAAGKARKRRQKEEGCTTLTQPLRHSDAAPTSQSRSPYTTLTQPLRHSDVESRLLQTSKQTYKQTSEQMPESDARRLASRRTPATCVETVRVDNGWSTHHTPIVPQTDDEIRAFFKTVHLK